MKTKITLRTYIAMIFLVTEITLGVGLVALLALIPYSESMVNRERGSLGLFVIHGSPDWAAITLLPNSREGTLNYRPQSLTYLPIGKSEFGNITFGNFRFHTTEGDYHLKPSGANTEVAVIDNLEGTVTFKHPANAADILASVKWPFIISMLSAGGITIAILELIRRMIRSVDRGQAFTAANLRRVRQIGLLFIAAWLLKLVTTGWLKYRMVAYVMAHVAKGSLSLDSSTDGDWFGLTMGFVILALAEVFRQGLALKEENTLTI